MNKGADFSADNKHRFKLWRIWDNNLPMVMCIGLNPSTANAETNDPTIRNLIETFTRMGFGGFYMVNCFSIISSTPGILDSIDINDSIGTDNHYYVGELSEECSCVVFAWGDYKVVSSSGIDKRWIEMFPNAKCFGKNKNGTPKHPMGLARRGLLKNVELIKYN